MNTKKVQIQNELFDEFLEPKRKPKQRRRLFREIITPRIIVSYENLILLFAGVFVAIIISFSLGVEKGKRISGGESSSPFLFETTKSETASSNYVKIIPVSTTKEIERTESLVERQDKEEKLQEVKLANQKSALEKPYTIQVATFEKAGLAQEEKNWLSRRGYYTFIIPSGKYSLICVGEYATKEEADGNLKELKKRYKDCFLRRR